MNKKDTSQEDKGVYVTIRLDPQLNAYIEEKTKESMLSKKRQILYLLKLRMRVDGYVER